MPLTLLTLTAIVLSLLTHAADQTATNQTLVDPRPSDARMNQFEDVKGTSWKVFAVESCADCPLAITEVQEIRQHNPPSSWAVFVRNRSLMPVASYTIAAAVVTGEGNVKAIQPLPAIRNLQPAKVSRQEMRVRLAVLAPTDRVVFFVNEVSSETAQWKAANADISTMIRLAAARLPVP
jgi:hypothetical protein